MDFILVVVNFIVIVALVLGVAWFVVAEFSIPAASWFEDHRTVRPVLLAVMAILLLALLLLIGKGL